MKRLIVILLSICVALIIAIPIVAQAVTTPTNNKTAVTKKPLTALEIINEEGQFVFTDGSSSYMFKKDGTFKSFPMDGFNGRMIEGTWKSDDYAFVIRGVWSWVNGTSSPNDQRKMTLRVFPRQTFKTVKYLRGSNEIKPVNIYDCYFEIEELIKIPEDAKSSSNQ